MKLNIVILRVISPVHRECMNHWRIRFGFDARYARDRRALMYFTENLTKINPANQILFPSKIASR